MTIPTGTEAKSTASFEFSALREAGNYRRALLKEFGPNLKGSVIEIGAGVGQITEMLLGLPGLGKLVSVEPDPDFCKEIKRKFPAHSVVNGTIGQIDASSDWDAIVSINVLEHIGPDESELAAYRKLLAARSGTLNLFVPARPEIYAPIDKDFGHFRRYTKPELRKKLELAGFKIERLRYYNLVGYFAWWLTFCVLKKREFNANSVRLFDRVIFPCVHLFETHVVPPPIGQSLLVVARALPTSPR